MLLGQVVMAKGIQGRNGGAGHGEDLTFLGIQGVILSQAKGRCHDFRGDVDGFSVAPNDFSGSNA